jgi:hypothetical protein
MDTMLDLKKELKSCGPNPKPKILATHSKNEGFD